MQQLSILRYQNNSTELWSESFFQLNDLSFRIDFK